MIFDELLFLAICWNAPECTTYSLVTMKIERFSPVFLTNSLGLVPMDWLRWFAMHNDLQEDWSRSGRLGQISSKKWWWTTLAMTFWGLYFYTLTVFWQTLLAASSLGSWHLLSGNVDVYPVKMKHHFVASSIKTSFSNIQRGVKTSPNISSWIKLHSLRSKDLDNPLFDGNCGWRSDQPYLPWLYQPPRMSKNYS